MSETFDFDDGNGPVPAHRHPNGGGWVADTAYVGETAFVGEHACVFNDAGVYGKSWIYGEARVSGRALVSGQASVHGKSWVYDKAWVHGEAQVCGEARVYEKAQVFGEARVYEKASVHGGSVICGYSSVYGEANVYGQARVHELAQVYGQARVFGEDIICGEARIYGDMHVWAETVVSGDEQPYEGKSDHHPVLSCQEEIGEMIDFSKPVQTKSGGKVRILATDRVSQWPVVALVNDRDVEVYTIQGRCEVGSRGSYDLINVPDELNITLTREEIEMAILKLSGCPLDVKGSEALTTKLRRILEEGQQG